MQSENDYESVVQQRDALLVELHNLKSAITERIHLNEEIKKAGTPPHSDFWHQSIYMADKKVKEALSDTPVSDALTANLMALSVENAELNLAINKIINWPGLEIYTSAWEFNNSDGYKAADLLDLETPATNAFTSELMAKGVDALAVKYRNMIETMHPDTIAYGALKQEFESVIKEANKFAAQLRKGVNDAQ